MTILPSLLSADFSNLSRDIMAVEECGVSGLHCDIMDGHFVPNITFGPIIVKAVRSLTDLPLRTHLMIEKPERYIEDFVEAGASEITVHAETCPHLHRTIQQIKSLGVPAGVALNPSTPICMIEHVISDIDMLLVMTVNPGFGGQTFIEGMLAKITEAYRLAEAVGVEIDIAVDGGIDVRTAPRVVRAGANVLIAGSSVFGERPNITGACEALIAAAESARA